MYWIRRYCPEQARILGAPRGKKKQSKMYSCYILRCADDSFYVGVAEDAQRRCAEHNRGKGADWTARRLPVFLVWTEFHDSLSSARKRENQLKRWSHVKKEALIGGSLRLRSGQTHFNAE